MLRKGSHRVERAVADTHEQFERLMHAVAFVILQRQIQGRWRSRGCASHLLA
jgi:hypothetical protein